MKKIFVCAGMGLAKNENINEQAKQVGKLIAKMGYCYVQGGSNSGLMGLTLNEFLKYSDKVEFLIPEKYFENDFNILTKIVKYPNSTKTMGEADRLFKIKECNAIIVLPGGTGTLEELLYCNETSRANEHTNKIILVNIDGFYDGFLKQIDKNIYEGLSKNSAIKFATVESVEEINFEEL